MMRCRVIFEFRDAQGSLVASRFDPANMVACRGEADIEALEAAFLVAIQHQRGAVDRLKKLVESRYTPGHD